MFCFLCFLIVYFLILEPKVDAYMDNAVAVLDFASLYPSIMICFNICPSTCTTVKPPKDERRNYKEIELDDGGECVWVHQGVAGVIPIMLQNLLCERKRVKKEMNLIVKDTVEGRTVYDLLDAKQKALKVSANSIYGIFGAGVGMFAFIELSRAVCAVGRSMLSSLVKAIDAKPNMDVVYGDSVSASTSIVLREFGTHRAVSIETFWTELTSVESIEWHGDKEAYHFDSNIQQYEIYSDQGWTRIKRIIRHKPESKRLYRVKVANGSTVEVTGDHSMLLLDGSCISPSKLKVGDVLLTNRFEEIQRGDGELSRNEFVGIPNFSKDVGENEMHLFDLYHTQLMIRYLGPLFVEVIVSGQVFKIIYNCSEDPFFASINPGTITNIIRFNVGENDWVYDLETENHHFSAGLGTLVVHNTDSVFVKLPPALDDKEIFEMGTILADELTTDLFEAPILLEFEKIYKPFILFKKKNYVGMKLERLGGEYEMEDKGLISVQRSTPTCVARIYQQVIDSLFQEKNPFILYEMTKAYLEKMMDGEIPFLDFVQSARLKDDYVNPLSIPHARVAMAVNNRANSTIYTNGDRVQYVRYSPPGLCTFEVNALNVADKVEDPNFVLSRHYKIDYHSYIQQMQKAFLELAKFFPEVYRLEQILFSQSLNDDRVHDGLVKVRGVGKTKMVDGVAEKSKPLKKRKISTYFLPIVK